MLYRIRHAEHHHTGNQWCIYPMYDFAHCLSDYVEGITHSICTLEFEVHRPLYDWILEKLELPRPLPHQYEFARLSLGYTVMSKRKLMQLVSEGLVAGWDDPRMPTISGLRRRGVTPQALREFAYNIGITKYNGITDVAVLEFAIREDLNRRALRRMGVLRPVKVVITNYPEGQVETVRYELPADVPHVAGMPRPVDVHVADREGNPVSGLAGRLFAIRPSDTRLNQTGDLTELPQQPGRYRTLVRMDEPGAWELRIDATESALRFVHAARFSVRAGPGVQEGTPR